MVEPMSPTLAKVLLVGAPFLLSLSWFAFWVVKILRTAKKLKNRASGIANGPVDEGSSEGRP
jgi:hypothetical protein